MSNKYEDDFSEGEFIKLIRKVAGIVPFAKDAVSMYYCFTDDDTPIWVKTSIVGALGYFICPIDAIPDAMPIVGWLDDAGVISAAYAVIKSYIKEEHIRKAEEFLNYGG